MPLQSSEEGQIQRRECGAEKVKVKRDGGRSTRKGRDEKKGRNGGKGRTGRHEGKEA
jgi:hypothetical protein